MHRFLPLLIALAVSTPILADEPNGIRTELDKAKKAHLEAAGKAKNALLAAFDETIKTIAGAGDLDGVKALQVERKAFVESGKLPVSAKMGSAASEYSRVTKQAKATLDKAYEQAIKDYTKALKFEQAEAVRKEWKEPQPTAKVPDPEPVPSPPTPAPRPSQLIKDRAALTARLADTMWTWGEGGKERVSFKADGTVMNQSSKLAGTWVAASGTRVVITWSVEPASLDLLIFDASFTSMNAVFVGSVIEKNGHVGKLIRR